MDGISVGAAAVADDRTAEYGFSANIYAEGTDVPINYTHPGVRGGSLQIVVGRPYVRNVMITSSPDDGWDAYCANQTIEISLTFDTDVVVEGAVTVDLQLGYVDDNRDEATRRAGYLRGSGADTLVFGYTVRPGDMDTKGVRIPLGIVLGSEQSSFGGSGTIQGRGNGCREAPILSWRRSPAGSQGGY